MSVSRRKLNPREELAQVSGHHRTPRNKGTGQVSKSRKNIGIKCIPRLTEYFRTCYICKCL